MNKIISAIGLVIGIFLSCNCVFAVMPPWSIFEIPSQTLPRDIVVDSIIAEVNITKDNTLESGLLFDVTQTYSLQNIGNETLEINPNKKIREDLTNFTADKIQLKPEEKANLTVHFLTYAKPSQETGQIRVIVDFDTYDIYETDSNYELKPKPSLLLKVNISTTFNCDSCGQDHDLTVKKEVKDDTQTVVFHAENIGQQRNIEFILEDQIIISDLNQSSSHSSWHSHSAGSFFLSEFILNVILGLFLILLIIVGSATCIVVKKRKKLLLLFFIILSLFSIFLLCRTFWLVPIRWFPVPL